MKRAIKYLSNANPFYLYLRKHFCPTCGGKVKLHYSSKIVDSKSPEAREFDFSNGDTFLVGEVEFRTRCFYCDCCQTNISVKEMKDFEKNKTR